MPREKPDRESIVCGRNPVEELLIANSATIDKIFVQRGAGGEGISRILSLAQEADVPARRVPVDRLNALAGRVRHQGVVAVASAHPYSTLDDVLNAADADGRNAFILYLDRVTDPRNLGAVLRSAAAFRVAGVLVPTANSAPLNAAAMKTSAGMARRLPVARISDPVSVLDGLRERGYWLVGADGGATQTPNSVPWQRPTVLLMGSEDSGLGPAIRAICDEIVAIPMSGDVESLNVSVAAAILMSAAYSARNEKMPPVDGTDG